METEEQDATKEQRQLQHCIDSQTYSVNTNLWIVKSIPSHRKKEFKSMLSTTLRRVLVASGLVVATSFIASGAFAATTGDVILGGTVASTLAISSSNPNTAIDLAASQTDATVKAADLAFGTNNSAGLTVASSGVLTLSNGVATPVPFTVGIVAGSTGVPVSYVATGATVFTTSAAAAPTTAHALYIKYSTAAFQDPGNYAGTVTLTVTDN